MTAKSITVSIQINATQEQVFAAITNWAEQSAWMIGTKVRGTALGGHTKGGKLEARTALGPLGITDTMTVTTWQPPERCSVLHTGNIVRGSGDFLVKKINGSTSEFTWVEHVELPFGFVGKLGWLIVGPLTHLGMNVSLHRFRHWVEVISK